jgi:uncharacterized membrane protein
VKLPSARAALVALGRLAAALTTSLAGALSAAVLLSAVALTAQQHLRLAAGTEEEPGRVERGRHGSARSGPQVSRAVNAHALHDPSLNAWFRHPCRPAGRQGWRAPSKLVAKKRALTARKQRIQTAIHNRGDADTLDALGGQLRDVLDEDLRGTLTDMYERLRAGLEQPRPPEAPQHPQPGATPMPSACRRTVP